MGRYFICLLAFLTIACCFTLQPAEATDDNGIRVGFGYLVTPASNRNLMSSNGMSWKTAVSRYFSIQNYLGFLKNEQTDVWIGSRFLYSIEIFSRMDYYFGWGVNYPISQVDSDSEEETHIGSWFESIVGFEYFFSDSADFGYTFELGVARLKSKSEDSTSKLGRRFSFGFHYYF